VPQKKKAGGLIRREARLELAAGNAGLQEEKVLDSQRRDARRETAAGMPRKNYNVLETTTRSAPWI
jgi:hypothetical protein